MNRYGSPRGGIARRKLRQDLLERLDQNVGVDASGDVRISVGPGLGGAQGIEFGDDQAAGETRRARIIAVDRRMWAGQYDATFALERLQALEVCRPSGQAGFQGVGDVCGNDCVKHVSPRF